jgi:outer membrane protein OmpA-like peptidoglycan-associated protein
MGVPRRDDARDIDASVERMWRAYANHIGIPDVGSAGGDESLPREERPAMRRAPRRTAVAVGGIVTAVAVVVVAVASGVALWQGRSRSPETVERQLPTLARAPAVQVGGVMPDSASRRTAPAETPRLQVREMLYRIPFDFGSDRLGDEALGRLGKLVVSMKANPDWRLAIEGHTDAHGPADYNQSLSERRAHAVKVYLQAAGVTAERLSAIGFGALRPAAPNDTASVVDRRVEIYRQ